MVADSVKVNMESLGVLAICRDIEKANAELYKYFAEIFSSHEEMAELWEKTAGEEENHANQFVLAIKLRREQVVDSFAVDGSSAKKMLNIIEGVSAEVRREKPSILESLLIAIKLEEDLAAFHMMSVVNFVEDQQKKLFTAMMKVDKDHVERMRRFYQRLSMV